MNQSKKQQIRNEKYGEEVKRFTPTNSLGGNCLKAFVVGGIICTIGQGILNLLLSYHISEDNAYTWTGIILVLISVLLTGFNIYPSIVSFGGAGALVPITGFANGVSSAAIEYKKEGQVFGIGCKIFTIAGPVILYGIVVSWVLGMIYYFVK